MWVESSKAFGVYPSPAFVFPTIIKANAPNPVQSSQTEKIAFPGCKSQPSSPVSLTRLPRLLFYLRVNPLWNYFYVSGVRELKGEDGKIQQKLFFSVATKVVQIFFSSQNIVWEHPMGKRWKGEVGVVGNAAKTDWNLLCHRRLRVLLCLLQTFDIFSSGYM